MRKTRSALFLLLPLVLLLAAPTLAQVSVPGDAVPDTSPAGDQRAGSVLIWNYYTSNAANPLLSDTRLSITNVNVQRSVYVHLFFVDGANCTVADSFLWLSPGKTTVFRASYYDPGTSGYLVAVAVNGFTGCPAKFNFLTGSATIRTQQGGYDFRAQLAAEAVPAIAENPASCNPDTYIATLAFDGLSYQRLSRVLALDGFPGPDATTATLLVVNRLGGSLAEGLAAIGSVVGVAYDDRETPYSFSFTGRSCQEARLLSDSFPNLAPPLSQVVPPGRSGWLKFWASGDNALTGAVLYAGAVQGGHNLHKLTFADTVVLTAPIVLPELTPNPGRVGAFETVSAASFEARALAPRAIVVGFGADLTAWSATATGLPLPATLAETSVRVRDSAGIERAAPLLFVSDRQINYLIPAGAAPGAASLTVLNNGDRVAEGKIQISRIAPALFTWDQSGSGPALAVDAFSYAREPFAATQANGEANIIAVFGTGLGADAGERNMAGLTTAVIDQTVRATVLFAGAAPGFAGVDQFNIALPADIRPGRHTLRIFREGVGGNLVTFTTK